MSSDEPQQGNGANGRNGAARPWPKKVTQAAGLLVGVGGIVCDYGLWWGRTTEPTHVPILIWLTFIGMAWGVEPSLWLGSVTKLLPGGNGSKK